MSSPNIVILHGGLSSEREVSLASGEAVAKALASYFEVELYDIKKYALPPFLRSMQSIVFPALHGSFGEDGQLQSLLQAEGIHYCGSDASSSRLCIDKVASKGIANELAIATPKSLSFDGVDVPLADEVIAQLGCSLVIKPAQNGSSIGLQFSENRSALGLALSKIRSGRWLIERRIRGRELTVGVLNGKSMGIVEIFSSNDFYDYKAKYTDDTTEYCYPAKLGSDVENKIKKCAEKIFFNCGCRDFARVDFLLESTDPYFLEINTLPGLTETSLLPKSAKCIGLNFGQLACELVAPALARYSSGVTG